MSNYFIAIAYRDITIFFKILEVFSKVQNNQMRNTQFFGETHSSNGDFLGKLK